LAGTAGRTAQRHDTGDAPGGTPAAGAEDRSGGALGVPRCPPRPPRAGPAPEQPVRACGGIRAVPKLGGEAEPTSAAAASDSSPELRLRALVEGRPARRALLSTGLAACGLLAATTMWLTGKRRGRSSHSHRVVAPTVFQADARRRRSPLRATMTVEPSCPATPSGSGRRPARSKPTRTAMAAAAKARFWETSRRERDADDLQPPSLGRAAADRSRRAVSPSTRPKPAQTRPSAHTSAAHAARTSGASPVKP